MLENTSFVGIINHEKVEETIEFIKGRFGRIQMFSTRNLCDDYTENIYSNNGIYIDYASGCGYIEVFGLTEAEYNLVANECQGSCKFEWDEDEE